MTKLEEIINKHRIDANHWADQDFTDETVEIIAKEYAEFCCEEQKKTCAENASLTSMTLEEIPENCNFMHFQLLDSDFAIVDKESILNCPTYKEEDGK
jgi:hypothetical protein